LAVAGATPQDHLIQGRALFIGYIINAFNVYGEKVVKRQREWLEKIPGQVKEFLSEKHCRNGLVERSWRNSLQNLQDYGQLTAISMENQLALMEFEEGVIGELNLRGTKELHQKACSQFNQLSDNILAVLDAY